MKHGVFINMDTDESSQLDLYCNEPIEFELDMKALTQNTYYKKYRNRIIIGEEGRKYKEQIHELTRQFPQILGPVGITLRFNFKDKRKRDLDNLHKCFIDSIKNRLIEDDDMVYQLNMSKTIGWSKNSIEVKIESLEE